MSWYERLQKRATFLEEVVQGSRSAHPELSSKGVIIVASITTIEPDTKLDLYYSPGQLRLSSTPSDANLNWILQITTPHKIVKPDWQAPERPMLIAVNELRDYPPSIQARVESLFYMMVLFALLQRSVQKDVFPGAFYDLTAEQEQRLLSAQHTYEEERARELAESMHPALEQEIVTSEAPLSIGELRKRRSG
jgi:hypothetical protein